MQIASFYELKSQKNKKITEYFLDTFYFHYMCVYIYIFFFIFINSRYFKIYMTRLFTVHPSCHFSISYLQFILKSNMPVLSGNISIGWPCRHISGFLHALQNICTSVREDFILEQGLKQGCVQSPEVRIK